MKTIWTKPYHGVTHAGTYGTKTHWVTVCDYGKFATLACWFPDCGFSPHHSDHKTAAAAKRKGAAYLRKHT